ncbi:lanthionine synthetase C family protein [Dactylosporangium sp. NPDC005572]|uniref:lanthionine synthetase C family protein n=1 Tax=Dactylosporangium sp. NPDC005572 TaxID=3156889 RepID=UPI0033A837A1
MNAGNHELLFADAIADQLADPNDVPATTWTAPWWRQSLAHGMPGVALLHIERAAAGLAPWERADAWLTATVRGPVTGGADSHPFYGVPAVAHALRCAHEHRPAAYQLALAALDEQVDRDIRHRLAVANARLDAGGPARLADFDAIHGLTGYGAYLLRRNPDTDLLPAVLDYLVRLTQPRHDDDGGGELPGWWVPTGPSGRPDPRFPDGHANTGVAHGIAGPLALLSLAAHRGITVPGHTAAIRTIRGWLDRWNTGTDWPYWITPAEDRAGRSLVTLPQRPSWCYGVAGVARAQQLAALALADATRQQHAERMLVGAVTDAQQLASTTDPSLCHGFAGLAYLAARTAADAQADTADALNAAVPDLISHAALAPANPVQAAVALLADPDRGAGLLDGAAGIALALHGTTRPPATGWDSCLLIA